MLKLDRPSPTESELLFEIDPEPAREVLTAMGGAPLLVQAFRSLGLAGSVREHVHVKQRQRGYDEATFVESNGRSLRERLWRQKPARLDTSVKMKLDSAS